MRYCRCDCPLASPFLLPPPCHQCPLLGILPLKALRRLAQGEKRKLIRVNRSLRPSSALLGASQCMSFPGWAASNGQKQTPPVSSCWRRPCTRRHGAAGQGRVACSRDDTSGPQSDKIQGASSPGTRKITFNLIKGGNNDDKCSSRTKFNVY